MTTPAYCTSCGHELGVGRFCTNCGRPVPGRHPEAEPAVDARPATTVIAPLASPPPPPPPSTPPPSTPPPSTPPPVGSLPPAARYPLFADDHAPAPDAAETVHTVDAFLQPVIATPTPAPSASQERSRAVAWWPWIVALVVLLVIAAFGVTLLVGGDDDRDGAASSTSSADGSASGSTDPDGAGDPGGTGEDADVATTLSADVPAVAPASRDLAGRRVTFVAANMWDGKPSTAWRMPGDGSGETIVFTLLEDTVLTEVGLINGYAKIDQGTNWYRGNRRIREVEWQFDDGSVVTQDLVDDPALQTITIDPVRTATVRLRLVTVGKPGKGPAGRDNTAISEVRFVASP